MTEKYPCDADIIIAGYRIAFDGTVEIGAYQRLAIDARKRGVGAVVSIAAENDAPAGADLELAVEKSGVDGVVSATAVYHAPDAVGLTIGVEKSGVGAEIAVEASFVDIPSSALELDVEKSGIQGSVSIASSFYVPPPPSYDVYNAVTQGGCHNNGSTDDLAHLQAAATAAKAAGLPLYLPAGDGYKLSSSWSLPTNITVVGDGVTSHVLGQMRMNTGCDVYDLFIGVSTGKALGFYTSSLMTNMAFTRCRFRGGTWNPVFSHTSAYQHFNGLTFTDCTFEASYFTTPWTLSHQLAHSVNLQTDRNYSGQLMDNLTFDHCHFGAENEYGQTENMYGNILFYSHAGGDDKTTSMTSTQYCDNLTVKNCIFEKSWNWAIDYAMNDSYPNRVYPDQYCGFTCTDNLFKGCGGHIAETSHDFPISLDLEPTYHATISGNVFLRCQYESARLTYGCNYNTVEDNIFDYRVDNGITPYVSGSYNFWVWRVINLSSGTGNTVTGNQLYLPTTHSGTTPSNNGSWIANTASASTISGNTVYKNDNTPPDYETIMDVGPRT